jgi:hypothetical protein
MDRIKIMFIYVDDNSFLETMKLPFRNSRKFELEFLGHAQSFRDTDFNMTMDHARYCSAIVYRFLEKSGEKKNSVTQFYRRYVFLVLKTALRRKRQQNL